jgi:60 kDa SS-A/Ro ribonucleoprotein
MKTNKKTKTPKRLTHEGAPAENMTAVQALKRTVMAHMLWENSFYESGKSVADRIAELVPKLSGSQVRDIAIEARENMKLRHVPLYLAVLMAKNEKQKPFVAETLARVIQRPDELSEALSIYWKGKKTPIAKQVKKGLAQAFTKFDEYSLAKWNKDGAIKLRDVLFLTHAKPLTEAQAALWKKLVNDELKTPDTWEVEISASKNKKASWERLLLENKLGAMALLRNLRNMEEAKVDNKLIRAALTNIRPERVLPFRFISAAKYAPKYEAELETGMFKCLGEQEKLKGKTTILIDVSGSMTSKVSGKSEISRLDAACGVAMLLREICDSVEVKTFSNQTVNVAPRRGFALAEAINRSQAHGGTDLGGAVQTVNREEGDRLIVITDEQTNSRVPNPAYEKAYMVNVASYQNGVGYGGGWNRIDGWSESVVSYIQELEKSF